MRVEKQHPHFFAEMSGVDLSTSFPDEILSEIVQAFADHSVLLFRGQNLDDEIQVTFSQRIGPLERSFVNNLGKIRPEIADLSNIDKDNQLLKKGSDRDIFLSGNQRWHTDGSFKIVPSLGSALSAREVPPEGGETEFADMRAAHDALDENMKHRIDKLTVEHSFLYSQGEIGIGYMTDEEKASVPPVRHPMVRSHPQSGRKAIYAGRHASHVIGMPMEEGRALIQELNDFATQRQFVHRHHWCVGDLVLWDNRMVMHRGLPYDDTKFRRIMHRTTLAERTEDNPWVANELEAVIRG